jgi:DNA-binding MarR family transcriptional regulator
MTGSTRKQGKQSLDALDLRFQPGHLLRRAQQRAVDLFIQAVGEHGLRPPQFAALLSVYQNPRISQVRLVALTGIDRSTLADLVDRLVSRGLIERRRYDGDQRVNALSITPAGQAALEACLSAVEAVQARILEPIAPERRASLLEALALIGDLPQENGSGGAAR